nr:SGNH/GDSL hydrolase family protein [Candidatus Sigynarchaeota archaeon]
EVPRSAYELRVVDQTTPGNGAKIMLESSQLPSLRRDELVRPLGDPMAYPATRDGKAGMLFSEMGFFHKHAILVTYTHLDTWNGAVPGKDNGKLPRTAGILSGAAPAGLSLDIFVFGDSISAGSNCSANLHLFPEHHAYPDLLLASIQKHRPALLVRLKNASVGGMSSEGGKKNIAKILDEASRPANKEKPFSFDLNILAWGANDAAGKQSTSRYLKNIDAQMKRILKGHPDAEFLVVASSMMNELWSHGNNDFLLKYREALGKFAQKWKTRVLIADITMLWKYLLERKNYLDLTGNGLNHPNDFGHRLYAQALAVLLGIL